MDCEGNHDACSRRRGSTPEWFVRREWCNPVTNDYSGLRDYLPCNPGVPCEHGCCAGVSKEDAASSACTQGDENALSGFAVEAGVPICACAAGMCEVGGSESLLVHDPNAKLGPAEAAAGEWISYTVQYENVGAGTAYGVYVEDPISTLLDANTLEIDDGGLYFPASRTIYWNIGELGPGAGGSVGFRVQVPTDVVSGTVIVNSATVYFPSVPETTPTGEVVTLVQDVVAHSQRLETIEGTPLAVTLSGSSPVGPLTYAILDGPSSGVLSGTSPNLLYTPAANFEGPDLFTFRVSDGLKTSAPAEVSIMVGTGAESTPPEVYATSPSPNETGVKASATPVFSGAYLPSIYVYFSEPIDPATVTAQTLFVATAGGRHLNGYAVYDASGQSARFVSQERLLWNATYTATVTTGVHDTSGNALAANRVWSFTIEAGPPAGTTYLPMVLRG